MNRQEYLLSLVAEECAEVQQRVSKALRFGLNEIQPGQPLNNTQRIMEEFRDLLVVVELAQEAGVLPCNSNFGLTSDFRRNKREKVLKFMDYSRQQGALVD